MGNVGKHVAPKKSKHPILKFAAGAVLASMKPPKPSKAEIRRERSQQKNQPPPRSGNSFGGKYERWRNEISPRPEPEPGVPLYVHVARHPNPLGVLHYLKCGYPHSQPIGIDRWDQMIYSKPETTVVGIGPARALGGKSASLSMPALFEHNGPAVVVSERSDAFIASAAIRSMFGEVCVLDVDDLDMFPGAEEIRWSLLVMAHILDFSLITCRAFVKTSLTVASNESHAQEMAHFSGLAGSMLAVFCYWANLNGKSFREVHRIVTIGTTAEFNRVLADLKKLDDKRAFELLFGILDQPGDRELGSIKTTLTNALGAYQTEAARKSSDSPNLDVFDFVWADPKKPNPWLWHTTPEHAGFGEGKTLYIITGGNPDAATITVAIISQIIKARHQLYREDEKAGNPNAHSDVLFVLDEMANTPLPDLPRLLAMPGRGCLFNGQLQDFAQLKKWGDAGETMLTQMQQLILFRGVTSEKLQFLETLSPTDPLERITSHNPGQGTMLTANASPERLPGLPVHRLYSGINDDPTVVTYFGPDGATPDWIHIRPYYSDPVLLFAQVASIGQMAALLDQDDSRRILPLPNLDHDGTGRALLKAGGPDLLKRWRAAVQAWPPANPYEADEAEAIVAQPYEDTTNPYDVAAPEAE
ncbi:UNVERIFIED_CONTAM: type IV secretory system conjugative DNA transfer family protein [Kocuria sp. CPCC 205316]